MPSDTNSGFTARYGDGHTASRVVASVRLADAGLVFQFPGIPETTWPYPDLRAADPLRKRSFDAVITTRTAGHASFFIDDTLLLAELGKRAPQLMLRHERWRSARPGLVVGLTALAAYVGIWAFDLSPAKGIANTMPAKARVVLGESVIRTMPAQRRCTNVEGRAALDRLMRRLMPDGPITADSIVVLDWQLVNAFAVPGNRLVLTRGIIEQARSADEIAAVIGHEAGHIVELHPEASLVRSVGFWALVQMVFTGTPGAIGNIGVVLAQLGYTRSAERAADGHALRLLREAGISPKGMADFFSRMETEKPSATTDRKRSQPGSANDIFSSHPSNLERISFIAGQTPYPSTAALSDDDWKALKAVCTAAPTRIGPAKPAAPAAQPAAADSRNSAPATAPVALPTPAADVPRAEAERAEQTRVAAAKAEAARLEADRIEAARIEAAKARAAADAARLEAEKAAAARAEIERATAEKKLASASPKQVPVPVPVPAASPLDVRIEAATKRIATDPSDAAAYYDRGQAYAAKRENAQALEDFSRVIALRPTETPALFWRASLYAQQKQGDKAVADYSEVIRLQPKNYAAYNNRGSVYRSQKKLDLALKDYSTAVSIDATQPIALTNRALVHRDRANLAAALADLNAAVAANPNYVNARVRRGETHELGSARDLAIADYLAALKIPEPAGGVSEPHATASSRLKALGVSP